MKFFAFGVGAECNQKFHAKFYVDEFYNIMLRERSEENRERGESLNIGVNHGCLLLYMYICLGKA